MDALVSIIVPVYNVEKYLRQCLDSIIYQSYSNLEIILVDDGSPDNSGAICDEYAARDDRIHVIHQKNGGLSAARNAGLDCAAGEYIAFVDSDDWINQEMIEMMVTRCVAECAELAICDVAVVSDGVVKPHNSPIKDACFSQSEFVEKMIEDQAWHYIVAWNKLYQREIFEKLRFPVGYIHEDAAIAHRVAGLCRRVVTLAQALYYYRQNPGSIMNSEFSIQRSDNLSALADRMQYAFEKKWNTMWNATASRYAYMFFDIYFRFPNNSDNYLYIKRMEKSLKVALPYLLKSKDVLLAHKFYLLLIRISPQFFKLLRKVKAQ